MYALSYDIGTTGLKCCLFSLEGEVRMVAGHYATYGLHILGNGGAEQEVDDWWHAMEECTHQLLEKTGIDTTTLGGQVEHLLIGYLSLERTLIHLQALSQDTTPFDSGINDC
ncbi:MAG: hypothetical protein IIZ31_04140, partial [Lachnospiraceae bacterium]|nr:hypothetical protein [Lachnospiraceae bacterium]